MQCSVLQQQYAELKKFRDAYIKELYREGLANLNKKYEDTPEEHPRTLFYTAAEALRGSIEQRKNSAEIFLLPEKYGPQVEEYEDVPEVLIEGFGGDDVDSHIRESFSILPNGNIAAAEGKFRLSIACWYHQKTNQGLQWNKETLKNNINGEVITLPDGSIVTGDDGTVYQLKEKEDGRFTEKEIKLKPEGMEGPTQKGCAATLQSGIVLDMQDGSLAHVSKDIAQEYGWNINILHKGEDHYSEYHSIHSRENGDIVAVAGAKIIYTESQNNGKDTELREITPHMESKRAFDCIITASEDICCFSPHNEPALLYKKKEEGGWETEPEATFYPGKSVKKRRSDGSTGDGEILNAIPLSNDAIAFELGNSPTTSGGAKAEYRHIALWNKDDTGTYKESKVFHGHSPKLDRNGNILFINNGNLNTLRPKTFAEE